MWNTKVLECVEKAREKKKREEYVRRRSAYIGSQDGLERDIKLKSFDLFVPNEKKKCQTHPSTHLPLLIV